MNHVFFLLPFDFTGFNCNESITCRLNLATAWSSRSCFKRWPSTYYLNGVRTRTSTSRSDCLHVSKSRRNHHRKHFAKITSNHFALMSTSIANCKFLFRFLSCFIANILNRTFFSSLFIADINVVAKRAFFAETAKVFISTLFSLFHSYSAARP